MFVYENISFFEMSYVKKFTYFINVLDMPAIFFGKKIKLTQYIK